MNATSSKSNKTQTFSMKTTAQMVALNSHTIRAWERRYKALDPSRDESNNRRVYSPQDVERLLILSKLVKAGHVIGHIARLDTEYLKSILTKADPTALQERVAPSSINSEVIERCMSYIENYRLLPLKCELSSYQQMIEPQLYIERIILSLLHEIDAAQKINRVNAAQASLAFDTIQSMMIERSLSTQISNKIRQKPGNDSRRDQVLCLIPNPTKHSVAKMHALSAYLASHGHICYVIESQNSQEAMLELLLELNTEIIIFDTPEDASLATCYQKFLKNFLRSIPRNLSVWQFTTLSDPRFQATKNLGPSTVRPLNIQVVNLRNIIPMLENHVAKILRVSPKPREKFLH